MYPFPTYVTNKTAAGCAAAVVGISMIAWLIQSIQTRFQPRRVTLLLLASHLAIFCQLIIRVVIDNNENSKIMFGVLSGLLTVGLRMMVISNFSFVLQVHHDNTRLARVFFLIAVLFVFASALLMIPANSFSFNPDKIDQSFLYRRLSASILIVVTIGFYVILFWSKTIEDMKLGAIVAIMTSSTLCLSVAILNLVQAISRDYYEDINSNEGWFYGLEMCPIILAHVVWSSFHPKRTVPSLNSDNDTSKE